MAGRLSPGPGKLSARSRQSVEAIEMWQLLLGPRPGKFQWHSPLGGNKTLLKGEPPELYRTHHPPGIADESRVPVDHSLYSVYIIID